VFSVGYLGAVFLIPLFAFIYFYVYFYCLMTLNKLSLIRIGVVVFLLSAMPWGLSLGSTYVIFSPMFLTVLLVSVVDGFILLRHYKTNIFVQVNRC